MKTKNTFCAAVAAACLALGVEAVTTNRVTVTSTAGTSATEGSLAYWIKNAPSNGSVLEITIPSDFVCKLDEPLEIAKEQAIVIRSETDPSIANATDALARRLWCMPSAGSIALTPTLYASSGSAFTVNGFLRLEYVSIGEDEADFAENPCAFTHSVLLCYGGELELYRSHVQLTHARQYGRGAVLNLYYGASALFEFSTLGVGSSVEDTKHGDDANGVLIHAIGGRLTLVGCICASQSSKNAIHISGVDTTSLFVDCSLGSHGDWTGCSILYDDVSEGRHYVVGTRLGFNVQYCKESGESTWSVDEDATCYQLNHEGSGRPIVRASVFGIGESRYGNIVATNGNFELVNCVETNFRSDENMIMDMTGAYVKPLVTSYLMELPAFQTTSRGYLLLNNWLPYPAMDIINQGAWIWHDKKWQNVVGEDTERFVIRGSAEKATLPLDEDFHGNPISTKTRPTPSPVQWDEPSLLVDCASPLSLLYTYTGYRFPVDTTKFETEEDHYDLMWPIIGGGFFFGQTCLADAVAYARADWRGARQLVGSDGYYHITLSEKLKGESIGVFGGVIVDDGLKLVIEGNGLTIDAEGEGYIFKVNGGELVLRNLTLKGGHADESLEEGRMSGYFKVFNDFRERMGLPKLDTHQGGAVRVCAKAHVGSLTLENCRIEDCIASEAGGAIYMENDGCSVTVRNSSFVRCGLSDAASGMGGAIAAEGKPGPLGKLTLENVVFAECGGSSARNDVIYLGQQFDVEMSGIVMSGGEHGGIFVDDTYSVMLSDSLIVGNGGCDLSGTTGKFEGENVFYGTSSGPIWIEDRTQVDDPAEVIGDVVFGKTEGGVEQAFYELRGDLAPEGGTPTGWIYELVDDGAKITRGGPLVGAVEVPAELEGHPVTAIGMNAFDVSVSHRDWCTNMTSITLPKSVRRIEANAFRGCSGLVEVNCRGNVTNLASRAFYGCSALQALNLRSEQAPYCGMQAFKNANPEAVVYVPLRSKGWNGDFESEELPPTWNGVKIANGGWAVLGSATLGEPCSFDLERDLHVAIDADYAAGDTAAVKFETLPKGLKVVQDKTTKAFTLSGTPTEVLDFEATPMYARVTVTKKVDGKQVKTETLQRVAFEVAVTPEREFAVGEDVNGARAIEVDADVTAVGGLPAGLKFTAKALTKVNRDKTVTTNALAYTVYGAPTKPGLFTVTFTHKNGKVTTKTVEHWRVNAENPGLGAEEVDWAGAGVPFSVSELSATMLQGVNKELAVDQSALAANAKVTFTGLPSGLSFKNGKIVGTPSKVESKVVSVKVVQNGLTVTKRFVIVIENRQLVVVNVGAGTGKVTGAGGYAVGKKVTLKATAAAGSAFAGWFCDAECTEEAEFMDHVDYRNPTVNYMTTEKDVTFYAKFVTTAEELSALRTTIKLSDDVLDPPVDIRSADAVSNMVSCGVALNWPLAAEGLSLNAISVAGLPAGLKFTAKDVVDSKTKTVTVPANTIYGVPTAASKQDKNGALVPSTVKVTVTTGGKQKVVYEINLTVLPLPDFVVGTFNGDVEADEALVAAATITVDSKGKISGKINEPGGRVWTIAAACFAGCDLEYGEYCVDFVATCKDTTVRPAVTHTRVFAATFSNTPNGGAVSASKSKEGEDDVLLLVWAEQNAWKTLYKQDAEVFFKDGRNTYRMFNEVAAEGLAEGQSLSLKIETTGKVTGVLTDATGTFTATTTLLPLTAPGVRPMAAEVYLVFVPNATKKFDGLAVRAQLEF